MQVAVLEGAKNELRGSHAIILGQRSGSALMRRRQDRSPYEARAKLSGREP
jgi:hypothetical protein